METNELSNTFVLLKETIEKRLLEVNKLYDKAISNLNKSYENKYKAINILKEVKEELDDIIPNIKLSELNEGLIMCAIIHYNLGILHSEIEETKTASDYFVKCLTLLNEKELQPNTIIPAISVNNQLGLIRAEWNQPAKAKLYLDKAEELYINYTTNIQLDPINVDIMINVVDAKGKMDTKNQFKKLHILTLYYLAQVHGSLGDKHNFAVYCHRTLNLQLSLNEDLDYIDWALNAATLSQYFIENDAFYQAKHHLAAASYILEKYKYIMLQQSLSDNLHVKIDNEKKSNEKSMDEQSENFNHREADIARCWVKYGIALLSVSKERLLKAVEEEDRLSVNNSNPASVVEPKIVEDLKFVDLEENIKKIANQITDKYLLDYNDARLVFLNIQKWIHIARLYYTLDNHASDYAYITQDFSQAYKYLSFYEEHEDRQAKMHKQRINMLEIIIKELNPRYYKTICRDIWVELGEIYSNILDIKIDRLRMTDEKQTTQMVNKINHLAENSINYFKTYLDSLEITTSSDGIKSFSDDQLYRALSSYFHIGRLYNKIVTNEIPLKIENITKSILAYNFVVNYYDQHPEKTAELKTYEFIYICREFAELLPLTLTKLKQQETEN